MLKNKQNNCLLHKLTAIFCMSILLACPSVNADGEFSFFEFDEIPQLKYINPIYLNTNKINKKPSLTTINTSKNINLPHIDFSTIPQPSEYKKVNTTVNENQKNTTPAVYNANIINEQNDPIAIIEKSFGNIKRKEVDYVELDIEGNRIAKVNIEGLKTLSPEIILDVITTKEDTLFNTQLLQKDLQNIYSTGYFSDNMSIEPILNTDNTVDLTFYVEENLLISNIIVNGNDVIAEEELMPFVSNIKNKPQNLNEINKSIQSIQNYYADKGYILANVHSIDDNADGNLTFNIWEGVINKINIAGNERTKDYVIARNILTEVGSVYNEELLKKDLSKVFSTQIFQEVNREVSLSDEKEGTYDITIIVKEKSTNSIGLGGGIDTGLGAFGSMTLKEDNFLGRGQKLSLSGIIGSGILLNDASIKNHMNYQAELSFFEPHFINADNSLMAKLYFREMGSWNIPLAIEQRIGFKTGIEHKIKGHDNLSTSFSAGVEHIDLKEGDFSKISKLYNLHNLNIENRAKSLTGGFFVNLTPGIKYNNLDNPEVPREGIIAQAQFNEAIGISDFKHTNGRLSGAVTRFFPVLKKSSISLTGRAGIKVHGDDMPEIMAYRLGGPYSIRGFRMHGVGAGESFLMGSAEFATPLPFTDRLKWDIIKKIRLTFFVDAGKVFDPTISNVLYDRPLHAVTTGIGLRLFIPGIGPMSIDYGLPIFNPGKYGSEHGYVTFGAGGLNMYGYGY